jgi:hypothetical protein
MEFMTNAQRTHESFPGSELAELVDCGSPLALLGSAHSVQTAAGDRRSPGRRRAAGRQSDVPASREAGKEPETGRVKCMVLDQSELSFTSRPLMRVVDPFRVMSVLPSTCLRSN